ncbi:MAG: alpha/beta hydrolase [Clostridia bacterium]|nr:alpha/beta hydrolase [Clostridia bacterium]
MNYQISEWNGFSCTEFTFDGMPAKLVKPNVPSSGKWALKTEYFGAFPETEIALLNRGWHLAWIQNENRWAEPADLKRKGEFIEFVSAEFGLSKKCALVGMSCGGLYAVKTAALYPELISVLYLDAPVMNLLSCPFALGKSQVSMAEEYFNFTGRTLKDMLAYRDHPIDKMQALLQNDLPVVLVAGDSDTVVPYDENGLHLEKYYKANGGKIQVHIKKGGDHHPHGLPDLTPIVEFIEKNSE